MERAFFLYTRSSDVEASRRFYGELIGLEEIWHEPGLGVAYAINEAVQFSIAHDPATPLAQDWAYQPGWVHGLGVEPEPSQAAASWSIPLEPDRFRAAVRKLQAAGVEALRSDPVWVNYWSYVVKDPMGQTVELSDPYSDGPGMSQ
jgi:catechol 2,3-dioxygenase-like lactoylglutathione lyase family enzyme